MKTAELGRRVGYSTQQVRDLERLGVIPRAERGSNGYRRYREQHVIALRAYRALAGSIGPVPARQLMPWLRTCSVDEVAEKIDELHATLASARARVREARQALDAVLRDAGEVFDERDAMTISELAQALGVRTSTLRHWEHEGLVAPARRPPHNRRYESNAIADARIVAALRSGGYPIPTIARALDQLRTHGMTSDARELLDARLADLTRRSIKLLEAASDLHTFLRGRMQDEGRSLMLSR
ncbi:MerR family transcriptional regulator [Agromyces sp. ISL-38]|uniref:MerR family transcriptional regulator n=1 Tax=Agromyces sp. ISL-38 TaxID=2819107 RepID=UPI001BECD3DB|nr:MerR family transcriptional regulator [Agromyces sp. ISL-38]MBT2499386.1 MerR family transcriptional regulator [Agromyces sp. ISL-38]